MGVHAGSFCKRLNRDWEVPCGSVCAKAIGCAGYRQEASFQTGKMAYERHAFLSSPSYVPSCSSTILSKRAFGKGNGRYPARCVLRVRVECEARGISIFDASKPEKSCCGIHIGAGPSLVDVGVEHVAHAEENDAGVGGVLVVPGTKLAILRVFCVGMCVSSTVQHAPQPCAGSPGGTAESGWFCSCRCRWPVGWRAVATSEQACLYCCLPWCKECWDCLGRVVSYWLIDGGSDFYELGFQGMWMCALVLSLMNEVEVSHCG